MIKLIRVDYRLLHGQVIVSWLNRFNIERLIIIDDATGTSDTNKSILKIAKPQWVKLNIFTVKEALDRKNKISTLKENIGIIFGNTDDCLKFLLEFKSNLFEINYGAIPKKLGSIQYDKAIYLTDDDVENSKKLKELGYRLYSQQVPTSSSINLNDLL